MSKELSERKKKILHALVDLYISTGQPVSSSDIQSKYLPEVSSATVRSELSALEALGYIEQPHTSAGRVPLKDAYKFYVDNISNSSQSQNALTDRETEMIRDRFLTRLERIEDMSKAAAKIISDATNYTSFCIDKSALNIEIEEVKLVPLKGNKAVVLIVTDKGMLANKAIDISGDADSEYIDSASMLLNRVFQGRNLQELENFDAAEIETEIKGFREIFDEVLKILRVYVSSHTDNVVVEGALKMLDYPEYNNVEDAKNFLSVISDHDGMAQLLSDDGSIELSVRIGKEDNGVEKCAIVTAAYKVDGEVVGQAGVIGPERMDYKKVIGVLELMKKTMSTVVDSSKNHLTDGRHED